MGSEGVRSKTKRKVNRLMKEGEKGKVMSQMNRWKWNGRTHSARNEGSLKRTRKIKKLEGWRREDTHTAIMYRQTNITRI